MTVTSGEDQKNVKNIENPESDAVDLSELDRLDEIEAAERAAQEPKAVKRIKRSAGRLTERLRSKSEEPRALSATRLAFFLAGFVFAVWAAMVPYV